MKKLLLPAFGKAASDYNPSSDCTIYEWSDLLIKTATHFDEYAIKLSHDLSTMDVDRIIADESSGLVALLALSLFDIKPEVILYNTSLEGYKVNSSLLNSQFKMVLENPDLKEFLNPAIIFKLLTDLDNQEYQSFFKNITIEEINTTTINQLL